MCTLDVLNNNVNHDRKSKIRRLIVLENRFVMARCLASHLQILFSEMYLNKCKFLRIRSFMYNLKCSKNLIKKFKSLQRF